MTVSSPSSYSISRFLHATRRKRLPGDEVAERPAEIRFERGFVAVGREHAEILVKLPHGHLSIRRGKGDDFVVENGLDELRRQLAGIRDGDEGDHQIAAARLHEVQTTHQKASGNGVVLTKHLLCDVQTDTLVAAVEKEGGKEALVGGLQQRRVGMTEGVVQGENGVHLVEV